MKNKQKEFFGILAQNNNQIYSYLIRNGQTRTESERKIEEGSGFADMDLSYALFQLKQDSITECATTCFASANPNITEEEIKAYKENLISVLNSEITQEAQLEKYITTLCDMLDLIISQTPQLRPMQRHKLRNIAEYVIELEDSFSTKNQAAIINSARARGINCDSSDRIDVPDYIVKQSSSRYGEKSGFIIAHSTFEEKANKEPITIKLYATIKKDHIAEVMTDLLEIANKHKMPIYFKTRLYETNDMLTIRLENELYLDEIVEYLKSNDNVITTNHPFMPMFDGIGITFDQGGTYNGFIEKQLKEFFKENPNGTYEEFMASLQSNSSQMSIEKQLFIKNIFMSLQEDMTIEDFKTKYRASIEEVKYKQAISRIKNIIYSRAAYRKDLASIKELLVTEIANFAKTFNLEHKTIEEILYSLVGKYSIEEYIISSYKEELYLVKTGAIVAPSANASIFLTNYLVEEWINRAGVKYAESGIRAFKLLYEDNQASNRYKNAKLKYGEDFETFMKDTSQRISYRTFKDCAQLYIERKKEAEDNSQLSLKK